MVEAASSKHYQPAAHTSFITLFFLIADNYNNAHGHGSQTGRILVCRQIWYELIIQSVFFKFKCYINHRKDVFLICFELGEGGALPYFCNFPSFNGH